MLERNVPASGQQTGQYGAGLVVQLVLFLRRNGVSDTRCILDVDLSAHTDRPYQPLRPAVPLTPHVVFNQPVRPGIGST
ncbi:hypothetical protein F0U59_25315 [Archangium gephyra]|nr:hypothetical protein F0U59_25315 [Archangium gephyra]